MDGISVRGLAPDSPGQAAATDAGLLHRIEVQRAPEAAVADPAVPSSSSTAARPPVNGADPLLCVRVAMQTGPVPPVMPIDLPFAAVPPRSERRAGLAVPGQAGGRSVARNFRRCPPGCRLIPHQIFGLGADLECVLLGASVVVRVAVLG